VLVVVQTYFSGEMGGGCGGGATLDYYSALAEQYYAHYIINCTLSPDNPVYCLELTTGGQTIFSMQFLDEEGRGGGGEILKRVFISTKECSILKIFKTKIKVIPS
jgi:hypothetical protein